MAKDQEGEENCRGTQGRGEVGRVLEGGRFLWDLLALY